MGAERTLSEWVMRIGSRCRDKVRQTVEGIGDKVRVLIKDCDQTKIKKGTSHSRR